MAVWGKPARPKVRARKRGSVPKNAASALTFLSLSCFVVAAVAALNHVRSAPPAEVAIAPVAERPAETPAAPETPPSGDPVADLRAWANEMTPKLRAYTSEASSGDAVKTREEAMAWCAGLTDEVDAMAAVRAAPDVTVETEYRGTVSEAKAVVAACLDGDGAGMQSHNDAMTEHMGAMVDRIVQLDPESATD